MSKLEAVLPLIPRDLERFTMLARSLERNFPALGRILVVVDDEDRENEGDLTIAAEKVTPQIINFMATHGRGLMDGLGVQVTLGQRPQNVPTAAQSQGPGGFGLP